MFTHEKTVTFGGAYVNICVQKITTEAWDGLTGDWNKHYKHRTYGLPSGLDDT
jgi:hypothetical protein